MLSVLEVRAQLEKLRDLRITVFGDFCLDAYWYFDHGTAELSVETGLPIRRVKRQRYTLGGAGNVVANLCDMGVGIVRAVGACGDDLFGGEQRRLLQACGADVGGFEVISDWQTMVYVKPMRDDLEENRIDFGAFNVLSEQAQSALAAKLRAAVSASDVVLLNQQVPVGICTETMIESINEMMTAYPHVTFVLDARHLATMFGPTVLKLNSEEILRYSGRPAQSDLPMEAARELAREMSCKTGKPVFLTRGEHGVVVASGNDVSVVPGLRPRGPVDPVGAGDSVVAALGAALGSGAGAVSAAQFANLAALVTVQKLHRTGTPSPAEIVEAAEYVNAAKG